MQINEPTWGKNLNDITDDGINVWTNIGRVSAHEEHWIHRFNYLIYEYDPTDDGPEVEIICNLLWYHPREIGGRV